jgi:hypothetical protein
MGITFKKAEEWLPPPDENNVFVEIGSDRYEGSTEYFANLAIKNKTVLHTVDLSFEPQERITRDGPVPGIFWYQADGSTWARDVFPKLNKTISCLYLDNFDYNWDVANTNADTYKQQQEYLEKWGIEMNNLNCAAAHLQQMILLLPFMNQKSIVICDDTYPSNDCWLGKCGAVIVYLSLNGYQIVKAENPENADGYSHGVILVRD